MGFKSYACGDIILGVLLFCGGSLLGCDDGTGRGLSPDAAMIPPDSRLLDVVAPDAESDGANDVGMSSGFDAERPSEPDIGSEQTDASTPEPRHRLDDELTFQSVQALGTHNSYHIQPDLPLAAWAYTHLPLDEQLGQQGVRQFELDIYYDIDREGFDVYHIFAIDQETTCETLSDCLMTLKSWSDLHLAHHPLLILIEVKGFNPQDRHGRLLADLERIILAAWPWERLLHPDILQGDAQNVRDAIQDRGWPSLGSVRGRAMFVLHDGGGLRSTYTDDQTSTAGRVLFPDAYGDLTSPIAAYHSMNDPIGGFDAIQRVVRAGHLVRTRADADSERVDDVDYRQFEAALSSGAHFISTDYPVPGTAEQYGVVIPDGHPSRCNPLSAPDDCDSLAIEDPAIVSP